MGFATNLALAKVSLSHLGSQKTITDIVAGTSTEEIELSKFFLPTLEELLTKEHWKFAKKVAALAGKAANPNEFWDFSYTYPADCLMPRRIRWDTVKDARSDHRQSQIPYEVDTNASKIYTDRDDAVLEYTENITAITKLPVELQMALSYLLAHRIAAVVTGGDPFKLGEKALRMYQYHLANAKANDWNMEKPDEEWDSEFVRDRLV